MKLNSPKLFDKNPWIRLIFSCMFLIAILLVFPMVGADSSDDQQSTYTIGEEQVSPYDPLIALLASYRPDPWGIYQYTNKSELIQALKTHDTEPDGATYILRTQLLPWHDQFQKSLKEEIRCEDSFYSSTQSWLELAPVILGLPSSFADLVKLPSPLEILRKAGSIGQKSGEILRDKYNEDFYKKAYENYQDYRRNSMSTTEDLSSAKNYVLSWASGENVKLDENDIEPLFELFEERYLCELRLEANQKLKDNERTIVAEKIQEYQSDLRKIELTFSELLKNQGSDTGWSMYEDEYMKFEYPSDWSVHPGGGGEGTDVIQVGDVNSDYININRPVPNPDYCHDQILTYFKDDFFGHQSNRAEVREGLYSDSIVANSYITKRSDGIPVTCGTYNIQTSIDSLAPGIHDTVIQVLKSIEFKK